VSETVWNNGDGWATGGGVSRTFPAPPWQTVKLPANLDGTGRPGRGVPDVAGNADIATGYLTLVHGTWAPNGGTSAVAPLYAGLVALLNEALGRPVGALAPLLYGIPPDEARRVFRDVTSGDNSVPMTLHGPARKGYTAEAGWDACTGFGSLRGTGLLEYLRARTVAAAAP
jgi:kumamolisin